MTTTKLTQLVGEFLEARRKYIDAKTKASAAWSGEIARKYRREKHIAHNRYCTALVDLEAAYIEAESEIAKGKA